MTDTALGHDGDRHSLLDALDHLGVAHARHATSCTDVGGNALECHNGTCTCLFSDFACSGVVTSIITPPFSICAKLRFSSCLFPLVYDLKLVMLLFINQAILMVMATVLGWRHSSELLKNFDRWAWLAKPKTRAVC